LARCRCEWVEDDFRNGVKFLTMAIDRFRNEKAHGADGNITGPLLAYEYLLLSCLAMREAERWAANNLSQLKGLA
jgi:hypothetical protein